MTSKRMYISGMHCVSCAMLIEGELGDIGVEAVCNYGAGYTDVTWDEKKIHQKEVAGTIERLGYSLAAGFA